MNQGNRLNLYQYQERVFPILLGWAVGSVATGLLWLRSASDFFQGMGSQFALWGLVDGLIAVFGIRSAERNAARYISGEIDQTKHNQQSRLFETIVWLNVILDLGYILGGAIFKKNNQNNHKREGMGTGIMIQGLFLLIWDIFLAAFSRKTRK